MVSLLSLQTEVSLSVRPPFFGLSKIDWRLIKLRRHSTVGFNNYVRTRRTCFKSQIVLYISDFGWDLWTPWRTKTCRLQFSPEPLRVRKKKSRSRKGWTAKSVSFLEYDTTLTGVTEWTWLKRSLQRIFPCYGKSETHGSFGSGRRPGWWIKTFISK